jgi:sugar lactone lactonase YvrE
VNKKSLVTGLALVCILMLGSISANAAPISAGTPSVSLLAQPMAIGFGSSVGPDDALYVTDTVEGRVLRVDPATGSYTTFASGLPKLPAGATDGGAFDVTFIGNTAYVLVTEVSPDAGGKEGDKDGIYRVDGPDRVTLIADIGAWSASHPPTGDMEIVVPTGVQFAMLPYRDGFVVNDAHHNRVLYVTLDGNITQLIQFDDVVLTGLARWGNRIYLAQAGPLLKNPPREIGKVVQFDMKTLSPVEVAANIPLNVDVEFGPGRTLYALSQGTHNNNGGNGSPADPNTGALMRVNADHMTTTVVGGINLPTSVKFIGNTAYVVCYTGEIWKIENLLPARR